MLCVVFLLVVNTHTQPYNSLLFSKREGPIYLSLVKVARGFVILIWGS